MHIVAAVVVTIALSAQKSIAQDDVAWSASYRGGSITFSVEASKTLLEPNRSAGRPTLAVTLPGELFDAPQAIERVAKEQADDRTPLGALQSDWSAQMSDDEAWVLGNFAAADRPQVRKWLADAEMRRANLRIVRQRGGPRVLGWARCNGALLVILEYADGSRLPATLIREQGRWKRTNALSAERTFDIVFAAVRERGTLTRTAPGKTGKK